MAAARKRWVPGTIGERKVDRNGNGWIQEGVMWGKLDRYIKQLVAKIMVVIM